MEEETDGEKETHGHTMVERVNTPSSGLPPGRRGWFEGVGL